MIRSRSGKPGLIALHRQANLGASPKQRADVRELRAAHHARIANLQAARQQVTASVTAGAKANNNSQVCGGRVHVVPAQAAAAAAAAALGLQQEEFCRQYASMWT